MEKDFDFKNVGKQMPYRTPDDFFDKMQKQVLEHTQTRKSGKQHRMRLIVSTALAAAAVMLGVIFFPVSQPETEELPFNSLIVSTDLDYSYSDTMDRFIESMSDEELAEWAELSENDIFMN